MSERDTFTDRKKALEEEYFRKKEKELIEKMRRRKEAQAERQEMGRALGVADDEILVDLQELGYTRESVILLPLVPLVQVAWAEGTVSNAERQLIFEVARSRGVEEGSVSHKQLGDWLTRRPAEEFFRTALRVIAAMFESLKPEQREASKRDLVSYCAEIASVSGGILGLGSKVSSEERAVIERIAGELERAHEAAAKRMLD